MLLNKFFNIFEKCILGNSISAAYKPLLSTYVLLLQQGKVRPNKDSCI